LDGPASIPDKRNRFFLYSTVYSQKHSVLSLIHLKQQQGKTKFSFIWFVRLLALRPLLTYCASLG
jgi:hypothetical protein